MHVEQDGSARGVRVLHAAKYLCLGTILPGHLDVLENRRLHESDSNELGVQSYKIARHSHKSWLFRSQVFVLSSSLVSNPLSLDCEGFRRRPTDKRVGLAIIGKPASPQERRRVRFEARLAGADVASPFLA